MNAVTSISCKTIHGLTGALLLMTVLSGCATFGKCGVDGCPEDAKITADVKARLGQYPDLQGINDIQVQSLNHVVYLTGEVSDGLAARTAESIARQTKGVSQVVNSISISK